MIYIYNDFFWASSADVVLISTLLTSGFDALLTSMFFFVWNVPLTDENGWGSQRIASGKAVAKNKWIVRCVNQRMWDENSMLVFFQVVILFPFHSRLAAWSFSMTLCRSYSWIQKHILDNFPAIFYTHAVPKPEHWVVYYYISHR